MLPNRIGGADMAYLFHVLDFPDNSRMTGVWNNTWADAPSGEEYASGHFVRLGPDQHVDVESDFLGSHLPFQVGGFGGAFPDGHPWLFVLQKAPADVAERGRTLRASLDTALTYNLEARVTREFLWSRTDLLDIYREQEISVAAVRRWPVADLLRGLLAECAGDNHDITLDDIVDCYPDCISPDVPHACEADVFTDIFAQWARQTLGDRGGW